MFRKKLILPVAACAAWFTFAAVAPANAPLVLDDHEEDEEEEEEDEWFAVVGGDVHTGTGAVLRGGTVLSKNGVIEEIGYDLFLPEETDVLDAKGYRVYPGLVAVSASTSVTRAGAFAPDPEELDHSHKADRLGRGIPGGIEEEHEHPHPHGPHDEGEHEDTGWFDLSPRVLESVEPFVSEIADAYDPFGYRLSLTLGAGITTVGASRNAIKLRRDSIEDVVMREGYLTTVSFSVRNPSSKRSFKEKLAKADDYLRQYRKWQVDSQRDKELKAPSDKGVDKKIVSVLQGTTRAYFRASDREDLLEIARLAQQYDFRPVIEDCVEGWTVASELGRAGATVIVTPRTRRSKDERLVRAGGSSIENAAKLYASGCQVAVIPANESIDLGGITGRDLLHLPIEAGFAIRGGLPEQAALESITIVPARILGVDHRVGSLEVGKDCDLIVTDGDVLHYQTFVQYAVVGGKLAYDKQEELFYRHIRPRPEPEPAPEPAEEEGEDEGEEEGDEEGDGDGEGDEEGEGDGEGDDEEGDGEGDDPDEEEPEEGDSGNGDGR